MQSLVDDHFPDENYIMIGDEQCEHASGTPSTNISYRISATVQYDQITSCA